MKLRVFVLLGSLFLISVGVRFSFCLGGEDPGKVAFGPARLLTLPEPPTRPDVTVLTVAGTGEPGDSVGSGALARFDTPNGGFVDRDGNVWVTDTGNHRIKKLSPPAEVSSVAGAGFAGFADGPAASALFRNPLGICVDPAGNAYVADAGNHRIRLISASGLVSTIAGDGTAGYLDGAAAVAQFDEPNDLIRDGAGNLFVSDSLNHAVRKISPGGAVTTWAGNGTAGYHDGVGTNALLNRPSGIALDGSGNLFVTEWAGHRVRKIDPSGVVTTLAGGLTPGLFDGLGNVAKFKNPDGIVVGSDGNIYIADNGNHAIRRLDTNGYVLTIAGNGLREFIDGSGDRAQFFNPSGIGWGKDGRLFVVDGSNHALRQIVWGNTNATMIVRHLPATYLGGNDIEVILETRPPLDSPSYTVQDHIPPGWAFVSASEGGTFNTETGTVNFGPFTDTRLRALSYTLRVPSIDSGLKQFSGVLVRENQTQMPILGDNQVQFALNADLLSALKATIATGGTLMLTFDGTISLTKTLEVTKDTILDGAGHDVTLSGNKLFRLFNIRGNVSLTLLNLRLADGLAQGAPGIIDNDPAMLGYGGCLANYGGTVILSNCVLTANSAVGGNSYNLSVPGGAAYGGAIFNQFGKLTLVRTRVAQSAAQGGVGGSLPLGSGPGGMACGGAIFAAGGSVSLIGSSMIGNYVFNDPDRAYLSQGPGSAFGGAIYASNTIVSISDSEFSLNRAFGPGSRWGSAQAGGGALFLAASTCDISRSFFRSNSVGGSSLTKGLPSGGGAILSDGTLSVDDCEFRENSVQGAWARVGPSDAGCGGAVFNAGQTRISQTRFAANSAFGGIGDTVQGGVGGAAFGGGIYNRGNIILLNNSFAENLAMPGYPFSPGAVGGALYDSGSALATNNTFSANAAMNGGLGSYPGGPGFGGAIGASNSVMVLVNATVAGNTASSNGDGGGIWTTNSIITIQNSILANPSGNCGGEALDFVDGGNNLSSDASCNFNARGSLNNTEPRLGPLDNYGGPTLTMPLLAGSPAIDAGNDALAPSTDQRGRLRPYGKASDVGAFESSPPYTIRGKLASFAAITNVSINAGDALTIDRGPFLLRNLASGSYQLTLSLTNYIFDPAVTSLSVGSDTVGVEFKAYQLNTLTPGPSTNGMLSFVLAGAPGQNWQIQRSTNLLDWQPLLDGAVPGNGLFPFADPVTSTTSLQIYRAQQR